VIRNARLAEPRIGRMDVGIDNGTSVSASMSSRMRGSVLVREPCSRRASAGEELNPRRMTCATNHSSRMGNLYANVLPLDQLRAGRSSPIGRPSCSISTIMANADI